MFRVIALCLSVCATSVFAEVTEAEALALARAAATAQNAEFGQPGTTVRTAFSDKIVALEISDPYRLNGETFWKTYTHYDSAKIPTKLGTTIGAKIHATQALEPLPAVVPDALRPKVIDWLGFWDGQANLDPELRVGARATKAWGFYLRRPSVYGPAAFIGVEVDGTVFRLDVNGPLVPWPPIGAMADKARVALFERLFPR